MNAFIAEIIGTGLLVFAGCGVVANVVLPHTKGHGGGWMVITTGWALAVFIGVSVAGPHSGAHLNPAVSIALAVAGKFSWQLVLPYILAQLLGGFIGAAMMYAFYYPHFCKASDPSSIAAPFATSPALRNMGSNFLSEVLGTFVLIFVILFFTNPGLGDADQTPVGLGSLGALPVALLVWVIGLSFGGTTGYAINPARDLGPRLVHQLAPIKNKGKSDWSYAWVPILGPLVGAAVASGLFMLLNT